MKVKFQTYNDGFFPARNVNAEITVIEKTGNDLEDHKKLLLGDIITSKTVYIGTIWPGEIKESAVTLNVQELPKIAFYIQPHN